MVLKTTEEGGARHHTSKLQKARLKLLTSNICYKIIGDIYTSL